MAEVVSRVRGRRADTPPRPAAASLLALDADLDAAVPAHERRAAHAATIAPVLRLPRGPAVALTDLSARRDVLGFYVAQGVLERDVDVGAVTLPELLGPGELLAPEVEPSGVISPTISTHAVERVTLLVLGAGFAEALGRWPALAAAVERRKAQRRDRALVLGAIGHLSRVEDRVLAVLWHHADAWGRVTPEGVVVPFPLTHAALGRFAAARRPTVSLAVRRLADAGLVRRLPDGTWLLPAGSAIALAERLGVPQGDGGLLARGRVARRRARTLAARGAADRVEADALIEQAEAVRAQAAQARRRAQA